jgi:hypothetical protein
MIAISELYSINQFFDFQSFLSALSNLVLSNEPFRLMGFFYICPLEHIEILINKIFIVSG